MNIFSFLKPYRFSMTVALLLMLAELAVELWHPLLMAKIIDEGITQGNLSVVWTWGAVLIVTAMLAFAAGLVNSFYAAHVSQSFGYDVRKRLFEHVQAFSFANFNRFSTSSLITRMTNDVTQIQNTLFMGLRIMLRAPLLIIGGLVMSLLVNWQLALVFLISVPLLVCFLVWMIQKGRVLFSSVQTRLDAANHVVRENLIAIRLIKGFFRMRHELTRFMKANEELTDQTVKALRVMELIMPILLLVMNLSILVVLWLGYNGVAIADGKAGEAVAVVNYAMRMTAVFSMFSFILMNISRAQASTKRIHEVLRTEVDIVDEEAATSHELREGTVSFLNVSFQFPDTKTPVLENISFAAEPGETIAILGATGSGKSALLQLIPRLYDSTTGTVLLDNQDIRTIKLERIREKIGFVPQEPLLFTGTVKENIAFGKRNASMSEIMQAAKAAQIHETICDFPNGYDTVLGQKGVNLSGGQKQRLSIARALVRKPTVLLLDDSTSALDLKTEARLLAAIAQYTCTTFIVTQKMSTAMRANQILLLEDGKLVAKGTHEELLEKGIPLYEAIVHSQTRGEMKGDATKAQATLRIQ